MSTTVVEPLVLTAQDRCDRCGAAAQARGTKEGACELLFCRHHLNENKDSLEDKGWLVEVVPD